MSTVPQPLLSSHWAAAMVLAPCPRPPVPSTPLAGFRLVTQAQDLVFFRVACTLDSLSFIYIKRHLLGTYCVSSACLRGQRDQLSL